jgi:hypothetical protein
VTHNVNVSETSGNTTKKSDRWLYQWGRKDPFLGSFSISDHVKARSTITWPSAVSPSSSRGTIAYATEHQPRLLLIMMPITIGITPSVRPQTIPAGSQPRQFTIHARPVGVCQMAAAMVSGTRPASRMANTFTLMIPLMNT